MMKKLWILIVALILVFPCAMGASADEWWERISLEAGPMMVIGIGEENQSAEFGYGAKIRARVEIGDVDVMDDFAVRFEAWPWGSYDTRSLRLYGQRAGSLDLYGVGAGVGVSFLKYFGIYGEFGYYFPNASMKGERCLGNGGEGQYLYWGHWINSTGFTIPLSEFETFERKFNGNIGGTVGLNFNYDITKHWRVGLDLGYRFLWLEEYRKAYLPAGWGGCGRCNIETKEMHNYGGFTVGLKVTYTF